MSVIDHRPRTGVFATRVRAIPATTVLSHHAALPASLTRPPNDRACSRFLPSRQTAPIDVLSIDRVGIVTFDAPGVHAIK